MLGGSHSTEKKNQNLMRRRTLRRREELANSDSNDESNDRRDGRAGTVARQRGWKRPQAPGRLPQQQHGLGGQPGRQHRRVQLPATPKAASARPSSAFIGLHDINRHDSVVEMSDEPSFQTKGDLGQKDKGQSAAGHVERSQVPAPSHGISWLPEDESLFVTRIGPSRLVHASPRAVLEPASAERLDIAAGDLADGSPTTHRQHRQRRPVEGGILLEESIL